MTFDELFTTYYPSIYHYLSNRLRDYTLAEDTAQDIFLQAYLHLPSIREEHAAGWLFTAASRKCIDLARHQAILNFVEIQPWHAEGHLPDIGEAEQIERAWQALPEHYRIPLQLFHEQDYTTQMIAEVTGATRSAIKERLIRGREKFKAAYRAEEEAA